MAKTAQQIILDIDAHIQKSNAKYFSDFYVGITNDIDRRLFNEHNVSRENDWWIYRKVLNEENARIVESSYLKKGMTGGKGGGDYTSVFVYCYRITSATNE